MRIAAALLVTLSIALAACAQDSSHVHRGAAEHRFTDAQRWARIFDDPARDEWQKPEAVIKALALPPDAVVADIGAGTGYFSARLARALPGGRVIAVDIEPDMVRHLDERARREKLANLTTTLGTAASPQLPAAVDLVLLVDTYHHIGSREQYFRALRATLKPGGRLAIVDFKLDSPVGPPRSGRLAPEQVSQELVQAGYALAQSFDFLPYQYLLVFRVASQ